MGESKAPKRNVIIVAVMAAAGVVLAGGITTAAWFAADAWRGGIVTAGNMSMVSGTPMWDQVTPGVGSRQSGVLTNTPTDFYSMPGDVINITQPVTTTLTGENLAGGITVELANNDQAALDVENGRIALSFHVEDMEGNQVAPAQGNAELGTVIEVPGLVGNNDGNVTHWRVVAQVNVLGDYAWTDQPLMQEPESWASGDLKIRLDQVREGSGFTNERSAP